MTPNDIDILLHYHVSPTDHPRLHAPAVKQSISMLIHEGLLYLADNNMYATTDRGFAHVRQLCNLPFPEKAWVGADGKVIAND